MKFPEIKPKLRDREYNSCTEQVRDRIVYEYLFNGNSHRWLDENVAKMDPAYSRGYISMGVLHYLGLVGAHKGVFSNVDMEEAMLTLNEINDVGAHEIKQALLRHSKKMHSESDDVFSVAVLEDEDVDVEYHEGKIAYRMHRIRERNPEVIRKAKNSFIRHNGRLYCEVCEFDFQTVYGERGNGFIEGHHKRLISSMRENEITRIDDIALLCPNCHRMIHKEPFVTVEELSEIVSRHFNVGHKMDD